MQNTSAAGPAVRPAGPAARPVRPARRAARLALVASAALSVVALTGCSAITDAALAAVGSAPVQERHFDTAVEAPRPSNSDDVAWFLPEWVPSDARDVDVRLHTSEPGYEISFTSADGVDLAACEPVDGDLGGPALEPEVLPDDLPTKGLVSCGDGRVTAQVGDRWLGWTTVEPVPGDDGSGTLRG